MIAVTSERRGVLAIGDHRVSLKDGAVVIDYQIVPRIFLKLLEVKP